MKSNVLQVAGLATAIAACTITAATLTTCGCAGNPTLPTPVAASKILLITPATVLLRPGDSETFTALLSSAPGDDLLPTDAQWSVDDGGVASVGPDGTVTARQVGHARLVARRGRTIAMHPLEVGDGQPLTWSGTYVPTSCTTDYGPRCTMSMKDAMYPRPFKLRFRRIGERVAGEVTLLAGYGVNERSGAFEGSISGGTMGFPDSFLLRTDLPRDVCCVEVRAWMLDARSATGTFIEIHGDPRAPIGSSLTFTNRILGAAPGER